MRAPEPDDITGKHKDTMKGMFNTKAQNSEGFHVELMKSLEDNKRKYDRQLYGDWLVKVYARCTGICIRAEVEEPVAGLREGNASLLREVERQCARNCMRKFDRAYKTFDQVEKRIFDDYIADEKIDPDQFVKALQRREEDGNMRDAMVGEKLA